MKQLGGRVNATRARGLFLAAALLALSAGTANAVIPASERQALIDLYNSTNGASWTNRTGWLGAVGTECSWYGVVCDATNADVIELFLASNNLSGTLPATLMANLTQAWYWDLHSNKLTGSIPSLSGLTSLQTLYLENNQLTGSIPSLSGLTSLSYLRLDNNQLTGSIPPLTGLTSLLVLSLSSNQLTGSIPSLSGSTSLVNVLLDNNQLTGSIPSLSGLTSLKYLHLYNNQLTGSIPAVPTTLQSLWVNSNALTGSLPASLASTSLNTSGGLNLSYNGLYTTDSSLAAYLESKQPGWESTQTIAPSGLSTSGITALSVTVNWSPIAYTSDGGYYTVYRATSSNGPFTSAGSTANKSAGSLLVTGLNPGTTYYFVVETTTPSSGNNANNANTVTSDRSAPVSATTLTATPTHTPTVTPTVTPSSTPTPTATITPTATVTSTPGPGGGVTINRRSSPVLYVDSAGSPALKAAYVAYGITNSGPPLTALNVSIGGFSGGVVSLAPGSPSTLSFPGGLATGETATAFFYLQANGATSSAQDHMITVTGSGAPIGQDVFSQTVKEASGFAGNKVNTVVTIPNPITLGSTATLTVAGDTGVISEPSILAFTPAARLDWPSDKLQLVDATINIFGRQYTNMLVIPPGDNNGGGAYTATYSFKVVSLPPSNPAVLIAPVGYISNAGLVKHTDTSNFPGFTLPLPPSGGAPVISSFTASPASIAAGESSTLSWTSTGGVSASIDQGIGAVATSGVKLVAPVVSTAYTLTVTGPGGSTTAKAQLTVGAPAPLTLALTPTTLSLPAGGVGTITATLSRSQGTDTTVSIASSKPSVASVPGFVTIAKGFTSASVAVTGNAAGAAAITASIAGLGVSSAPSTVTVTSTTGCDRPPRPAFDPPPTNVLAGNAFTLTFSPTVASDPLGSYQVDVSNSADCVTGKKRYLTNSPSQTISTVTGETATYCAVVRAISGANCPSDDSSAVLVAVEPAPASFIVAQPQSPDGIAVLGEAPPAGSTVKFKNIGNRAATLSLRSTLGFVRPVPAQAVSVQPGAVVLVDLVFDAFSTQSPGVQIASIRGTWNDGGGEKDVATAVTLTTLTSPPTGEAAGSRLQLVRTNEVHFISPPDTAPPPQVVQVRNGGTVATRVAPSIGPGGAWLSLSGDFTSPIQPGAVATYNLNVDRSRRATADGAPPVSTYLTFNSVDGVPTDRAACQVFDEEPAQAESGTGRSLLAPNESSLVLGSSASVQGQGAVFVSDGWIRNEASEAATVEMYYTPDGKDGLRDPSVRKATLALQPYSTYRLADFLRGIFDVSNGSGHVEIRSSSIASLNARTTVDSLSQKAGILARYGAEIPTVRSVQGASSLGGVPLVLPGIRGGLGSLFRTNVILAETSGHAVDARLRLYGGTGELLGEALRSVPPYSKLQVNNADAALFPSARLYDGASLEVQAVAGGGSLAAFATVIDNSSQGYTTRTGRFTAESLVTTGTGTVPTRFVVPAAAHSLGRNNSFYTTAVSIRNGTGSDATVKATYVADDGSSVPSSTLVVRARSSVDYQDVIANVFGITNNTAGMLVFEGKDVAKLVVASETSTPLDRADASKGISPSTLGAYAPESPEAVGDPQAGARTQLVAHPGLEESHRFRTNLILAEIAGQPVRVRVRVVPSGSRGATLAQRVVDLVPFQRLQIGSFIADLAGAGQDYIDVETIVEWVSGPGRAVAVATKIDNDAASKRADVYVLGPTGKEQGSIGF